MLEQMSFEMDFKDKKFAHLFSQTIAYFKDFNSHILRMLL